MGVQIEDHQEEMRKAIKLLLSKNIYVGITSRTSAREGPISNAAIGYIHENGSPVNNIPARPHLRPGLESVRKEITKRLRGMAQLALRGKGERIPQEQNNLGLFAAGAVQNYISDSSHFVPLAPGTVATRVRRGRQPPFAPLIDTSAYRRAMTYVIRSK